MNARKRHDLLAEVLVQCQACFPDWTRLTAGDFDFDDPKGFSSFTLGIRARVLAEPAAVLYRRLEGKENAILDFATEKSVYLTLAEHGLAARCHHYDDVCRIEAFYDGRTLHAADLFDPENLSRIAGELYRFHQLRPFGLPRENFWDLLFAKWGRLARRVLEEHLDDFPREERPLGRALRQIYHPATFDRVRRCLPDGPLTFCHNDTYHGNIMRLADGTLKLLDFEFSCRNYPAYDFSNLFAETVMEHGLPDPPHFRIAAPRFGDRELGWLIDAYLDHADFPSDAERQRTFQRLRADVHRLLPLSHFKYALAAIPLALEPIQKIRFLPYAHQRFTHFLKLT